MYSLNNCWEGEMSAKNFFLLLSILKRASNSCHKCGNQAVFRIFGVRGDPSLRGLLVRSTDERKLLGRF